MSDDAKPQMTVQEAGRRGGVKARDTQLAKDPDYYSKIGVKGGQATSAKHGREHFALIGLKGGKRTREKHGTAFYEKIGVEGGAKARALAAAAKAARTE